MKTNELKNALGVSKQDAQFILNQLVHETSSPCKKVVYAGETYRPCTIGEDKNTIWSVL